MLLDTFKLMQKATRKVSARLAGNEDAKMSDELRTQLAQVTMFANIKLPGTEKKPLLPKDDVEPSESYGLLPARTRWRPTPLAMAAWTRPTTTSGKRRLAIAAAAVERWPADGVPKNPRAWLVSTGRFKAIDQLRRRARFDTSLEDVADRLDEETEEMDDENIEDDRLRLVFTCCHPSLSPDAQVALTLREVCDLTTEEIARAFLTSAPTVAQRIVRAKAKIRAQAASALGGAGDDHRDEAVSALTTALDDPDVDVRASARYGDHDLGRNAERVRELFSEVKTRLSEIERTEAMKACPPELRR